MNYYLKLTLLIYAVMQLSGCSLSQITARVSVPLIEAAIIASSSETDLQLAGAALPANISMIKALLVNDPYNEKLQLYAAQAYYGYAFGFVEDTDQQRAAKLYGRCYQHAQTLLSRYGINQQLINGDLKSLENKVKQLHKNAVPALFWGASCWAKFIDLNRDKAQSFAQLPKAVMFMQRVLDLDEHYYMSSAHTFFGVYFGSKSPMLGGNYRLSEQHFSQANQANQNKLLIIKLLQAQYLERQRFNQQGFHDLLIEIIQADDALYPEQALINQIAKKKASLLLKKEELWF